MILAGDEFGRTQNGNNNAYCQDNEISWVDWRSTTIARGLIDFTKRLTALRRRYPVLRQSRFLDADLERRARREGCHVADARPAKK